MTHDKPTRAQEMELEILNALEECNVGDTVTMPWGEQVTLEAGGATSHLIPLRTTAEAAVVRNIIHGNLKAPPIPMRLECPDCGELHVDGLSVDGTDWAKKPHHTHACQHCGMVWRPAIVNTVGVRFLPGFKNEVQS